MINIFFKTLMILLLIYSSKLYANKIYIVGKNEKYKTITSALKKMRDGDTCIIKEGVYREIVNIKLNNVTLKGEGKVIVTGNDKIDNLKPTYINGNKVYKKFIGKKIYDVFQAGHYLTLARYPNKIYKMTSNEDWAESRIENNGTIKLINRFPKEIYNIKDGYYLGINNKGKILRSWYSITVPIVNMDTKGLLHVNKNLASSGFLGKYGIGKGLGYIIYSKAVLDTSGEWYAKDKYLYLIPLKNIKKDYEVRTRLYGLKISGNRVIIKKIYFKAASAWITGNNVSLHKCTFKYISPFQHVENDKKINKYKQSLSSCWGIPENGTSGVFISGNNFYAEDCIFSKSWWAGMTLKGSNAIIQNCLFEDLNWMAKRSAGLFSWGNNNKIRYCTFKNLGGSAIEGGNASWVRQYAKNNIWEFNYIEDISKLIVDQGFFYVNHQSGKNTKANSIWRYNVGKGAIGPKKGQWSKNIVGFYIDNSSSGYYVHNNIAINTMEGIRYNDSKDNIEAGRDIIFKNNTFYKCGKLKYGILNHGMADANVTLVNNLLVNCDYGTLEKIKKLLKAKNNIELYDSSIFISPKTMDFTPNIKKYKYIIYDENNNYIGAVNPKKGMWKYGVDSSKLLK